MIGKAFGAVFAALWVVGTFVLTAASYPLYWLVTRVEMCTALAAMYAQWVYWPALIAAAVLSGYASERGSGWSYFWLALYISGSFWNARVAAAQLIRIRVAQGRWPMPR